MGRSPGIEMVSPPGGADACHRHIRGFDPLHHRIGAIDWHGDQIARLILAEPEGVRLGVGRLRDEARADPDAIAISATRDQQPAIRHIV